MHVVWWGGELTIVWCDYVSCWACRRERGRFRSLEFCWWMQYFSNRYILWRIPVLWHGLPLDIRFQWCPSVSHYSTKYYLKCSCILSVDTVWSTGSVHLYMYVSSLFQCSANWWLPCLSAVFVCVASQFLYSLSTHSRGSFPSRPCWRSTPCGSSRMLSQLYGECIMLLFFCFLWWFLERGPRYTPTCAFLLLCSNLWLR